MEIPFLSSKAQSGTNWFGSFACVVHREEVVDVVVSGLLIGSFKHDDVLTRNILLVGLSKEPSIKKGALARAFGISDERRRIICRIAESEGSQMIPSLGPVGRPPKLNKEVRARILERFVEGERPVQVHREQGKKLGVSYWTVLRLHQSWEATHNSGIEKRDTSSPKTTVEEEDSQLLLVDEPSREETSTAIEAPSKAPQTQGESAEGEVLAPAPVKNGKHVQHLGGLLLVSVVHLFGLYDAAMKGWEAGEHWNGRLRLALDSLILALGLGQKCVEGTRRLSTPTAPVLLRTDKAPTENWIRRIFKHYVDGTGMAAKLHLRMTGVYLDAARTKEDSPTVFYIDNHMRPYTGKFTLRKGWRMQDKRVKPGVSDYYVHDEDGRPVCRVEAPGHDSLTDFLTPLSELLRAGLEKGQRILLGFDRAGAFPKQMAELRDDDVEFVTYERRPYPLLAKSAFTEELKLDNGEVVRIHEKRLKNLGKGRGRVRRISILTEEGKQVNALAVSNETASRLVEIITGRWVQENGFKHGNERWGINHLDRRKLVPFDTGTIIPNPARRRLDFSIRIAGEREGKLRNKLARLNKSSDEYAKVLAKLEEQLALLVQLIEERSMMPTHASVEETELADKLAYHDPHYKTVIDTIRIAGMNAEALLADELSPHLRKPKEAKKVLANIFSASGDIRVGKKSVTIKLAIAARKDERKAIEQLFNSVNAWRLSLPGDPMQRPLRFTSQF